MGSNGLVLGRLFYQRTGEVKKRVENMMHEMMDVIFGEQTKEEHLRANI